MNETTALKLIVAGAMFFTAVGVLGLAALGVSGVGLSLGALVPLAVAADGIARVVMHYGDEADERDRSRR